jgi:hypothetical protein
MTSSEKARFGDLAARFLARREVLPERMALGPTFQSPSIAHIPLSR